MRQSIKIMTNETTRERLPVEFSLSAFYCLSDFERLISHCSSLRWSAAIIYEIVPSVFILIASRNISIGMLDLRY